MTRVLTVIGARPQWMKASALSRALKDAKWGIEERVLHTGQHYSDNMAGSFVKELDLPRAHHALTVSTDPAERMGQMMGGIQAAIRKDQPAAVLLLEIQIRRWQELGQQAENASPPSTSKLVCVHLIAACQKKSIGSSQIL